MPPAWGYRCLADTWRELRGKFVAMHNTATHSLISVHRVSTISGLPAFNGDRGLVADDLLCMPCGGTPRGDFGFDAPTIAVAPLSHEH